MTQTVWERPDASVCKVWVCPTGWAIAREVEGSWRWDMHGDDGSCWWVLVECPDKLPPGPWKPCYLVGQEPEPESISEKERRLYYQSMVYDVCNIIDKHYPGSKTVCGMAEHPCDEVQRRLIKLLEEHPRATKERVTEAERAVLEAADIYVRTMTAGTSPEYHELRHAVDALRAARRPEKAKRPPMVAVKEWADVSWVSELKDRNGGALFDANGAYVCLIKHVDRVLPASEVERGYSPAEHALADEITKAMEGSRA